MTTTFTIKVPASVIEELIDATGKMYSVLEPTVVYFDRTGDVAIEFKGEEIK